MPSSHVAAYPAALSGGGRSCETRRSRDGALYRRARDVAMPTVSLAHCSKIVSCKPLWPPACTPICAPSPAIASLSSCVYTLRRIAYCIASGIQVECALFQAITLVYTPFSSCSAGRFPTTTLAYPLPRHYHTASETSSKVYTPHWKRIHCMRV